MKLGSSAEIETMSIPDTVKKKPRKRTSTASSSFEETEVSKPPTDVLALGKYLVRELGLTDGNDTLGKWMSHHVAELIVKAESAETIEEREKAAKAATTILKIWEHRKVLPYLAYPLTTHEELLRMVQKLAPDANPYRFSWSGDNTYTDRLAAIAFDDLTRLILTLLFMRLGNLRESRDQDPVAVNALDPDEKYILATIDEWVILLQKDTSVVPQKKKKRKKEKPFDLSENALRIISNLRSVFDHLEAELRGKESLSESEQNQETESM